LELVDEIQNPLRVASDLIDVGLSVDEVQELELFSTLLLYMDSVRWTLAQCNE
jgi:hypothetical protein